MIPFYKTHFRLIGSCMLLLMLSSNCLFAQKNLSMEEAIMKGRNQLAPENLKMMQWIPKTHDFSYVANNKIVRTNADNFKQDTLNVLPIINEKMQSMNLAEYAGIPFYTWMSSNQFNFVNENMIFAYNTSDNTLKSLVGFSKTANDVDIHPTTSSVAFTENEGLYITYTNGKSDTVAQSEEKGIVYGKAAHRNEFGITSGTFWSESANKLAFYRMDERQVTEYPIYELDKMPAQMRTIRYPFAGQTSHFVTLGVFDTQSKKTIYLNTGQPSDQYLTNITWSPDDKFIFVAIVNRGQNFMKMDCYDANNGNFVKTLFEEKHEKYLEPEHNLFFIPNKNNEFLWMSERNGFDHLYHYNTDGKLINEIHPGNFPITNFLGFDEKGKNAFFTAADESGMNRYTWKVDLTDTKCTRLQSEDGTHTAQVSSDGSLIIDNYTGINITRKIDIYNTQKNSTIKHFFTATNPLSGYNLGKMEMIPLKTNDGTLLNSRIILPTSFDASKKYPVVIYVYNGPHVQMVTNNWLGGAELWMHRFAQEGMIVYVLDGRGSDHRGLAFENATFRNLGVKEMEDQMTGVNYLKSLPYVDADRIGVYGWSYGGFMTTSLLTQQEGAFKVGVGGGPVIDWSMYEIMYTERYMDSPSENPDGYANTNLLDHAKNLKGRLLLIHGTDDDVVLWQHSLLFIKKCVELGKPIDYFTYPGHFHNVLGKDRVHLFNKIEQYFKDNL